MPLEPSALHQIDVFDGDGAAIAVVRHQNGKADGRFRRGDREHQKRVHLPDEIAEKAREGYQIDIHRQQDQLYRHEDDDHVLAVHEDAKYPDGEDDGSNCEIVAKPDRHLATVLKSLARLDLDDLDRGRLRSADLVGNILSLDPWLVVQRKHDGTDHGHEQHDPGHLKEVDVVGIEHVPERFSIWNLGERRNGGRNRRPHIRPDRPCEHDQQELDQQNDTDQGPHRQVLQEALTQPGKVDIEHHHYEQEKDQDRPDIDDDEYHRQELGAEEHKEPRGVDERENEKMDGGNGIG